MLLDQALEFLAKQLPINLFDGKLECVIDRHVNSFRTDATVTGRDSNKPNQKSHGHESNPS
jgi:hypothetical protein